MGAWVEKSSNFKTLQKRYNKWNELPANNKAAAKDLVGLVFNKLLGMLSRSCSMTTVHGESKRDQLTFTKTGRILRQGYKKLTNGLAKMSKVGWANQVVRLLPIIQAVTALEPTYFL
eukprot:5687004-Ditylum_brightwellii.AAC.1